MEITRTDIIKSFWQQGAGNCASIALIKANIENFGTNKIFNISKTNDIYTAILKNGHTVIFTEQELERSKIIGSFQPSRDQTPLKQALYKEIREYAQLCYAVMVAQYNSLNKLNDFEKALKRLSGGTNARYVSKYLGLENYASKAFKRRGSENPNMLAWQHQPLLKHAVYMSNKSYDYYGREKRNYSKFPKRIKFNNEENKFDSITSKEISELNYINISKFGTFQETGKVHSKPEDVDAIINHIKNSEAINKLIIHFHGGLVSEDIGMDGAEAFFNKFSEEESIHIVSIVWETGFLESLPGTVERVFQTDDTLRKLVIQVVKFFGNKFGINMKGIELNRLPESINNYASLFNQLISKTTDEDILNSLSEYKNIYNDEVELESYISRELDHLSINEELTPQDLLKIYNEDGDLTKNQKSIWWPITKIIAKSIRRLFKRRDHGVWATIIEESCRAVNLDHFATELWGHMKDQAKNMWLSNSDMTDLNQYAGRYLMDKLNENFTKEELEINIIAHSAGAVAVCNWVKAINKERENYRNIKFKNLIFLAPACRCELFSKSVMKYRNTYDNFTLFNLKDEHERKDNLIKFPVLKYLYTRSLLYLVSGICERKNTKYGDAFILGLHRHIRKEKPYTKFKLLKKVHAFLSLENNVKLILAKTDIGADEGERADPIHHGGFTLNSYVIESIKHIVKK